MDKLKSKDLISVADLSPSEIDKILNLAKELKLQQKQGKEHLLLKGKTLAMVFEKPSTRTWVSFNVGMFQLGGLAVNIKLGDLQLGQRESIPDIGRTLSRYVDGIVIRTFKHDNVIALAKNTAIPVINGLSDHSHPCQALSDLFTIMEKKGSLEGLKMAYLGDGNNVCTSLMYAASKMKINLVVATPRKYQPKQEVIKQTADFVKVIEDPKAAANGADILYTDVWASMGHEKEARHRRRDFKKYQVNTEMVKLAKKNAMVMHCLPAHRGEEITDEVIESKQSVVFDQAENRMHVQKAILCLLMGK